MFVIVLILFVKFLDKNDIAGNFHKWAYTPRGCALLYVRPEFHDVIKPAVTSHGYQSGSFSSEFLKMATCDNSPLFSVGKAIEFYESIGGLVRVLL